MTDQPPQREVFRTATIVELVRETHETISIVLDVASWPGHQPGQYVEVQAPVAAHVRRSYWLASSPEDGYVTLTVRHRPHGILSNYLHHQVDVGDTLQIGPAQGHFVWTDTNAGPVQLIAGGGGIIPFRTMLRHWSATHSARRVRVLYSTCGLDHVLYRDELARLAAFEEVDVELVLTRTWTSDWNGPRGRIDHDLLRARTWPAADKPEVFICGPGSFVDEIADALSDLGHSPSTIRARLFDHPSG